MCMIGVYIAVGIGLSVGVIVMWASMYFGLGNSGRAEDRYLMSAE